MIKAIYTRNAPAPIGPYSQAVSLDDVLYLSGQIALKPETGELISQTFAAEATQVFGNLSQVLTAAGLSVANIARVEIFMTNLEQFSELNEIYERWLEEVEVKPARQTIGVAALPKGASLEISCIAHKTI